METSKVRWKLWAIKAYKALFKLNKLTSENMSINTNLFIFNQTVKPIMLYASEVWAPYLLHTKDPSNLKAWFNKLEKLKPSQIELKFYKRLLQVKRNTTTLGVRGELGRHPLLLEAINNSIRYVETIQTKPKSALVREAFKETSKTNPTSAWLSKLKSISKIGRAHV